MKKLIFTFLFLFFVKATSQVGINTSNPDNSAILHLESANKGFLLPMVSLTTETDAATIPIPAKGLVVYNTTNNIAGEGIYVNSGTPTSPKWSILTVQNSSLGETTKKFSYVGAPNPNITTSVGNLEFRFNETSNTDGQIFLQCRMISAPVTSITYMANRISWFGVNTITSSTASITFTPTNYNVWQTYNTANKVGASGIVSFLTYISSLQDRTFYESRANTIYGATVSASGQLWSCAVTAY